jgi:hypothetical protein
MAKTDLTGKVITIDGVDYKLVAVEKTEKTDKRNKVIVGMETPIGIVQQVFNRYAKDGSPFPLEEGKYEEDGHTFHVEYATEDEVAEKVGKPISDLTDEERMLALLGMMAELED